MTAVVSLPRSRRRGGGEPAVTPPPLSPGLQMARAALFTLLVLTVSLLIELLIVSSVQQRTAQQRSFDTFRSAVANGTAPLGPTDGEGRALAIGTPVSYLEIPSIGLRQVVVEGTTPSALFSGPGHRRDTPLPGQAGTSIILGRRAAFGGPFAQLGQLKKDATIRVTTGQGVFQYRVLGQREEGDPAPTAPKATEGRLILATASGRSFMPSGVLRIDAKLIGTAFARPAAILTTGDLPAAEEMMGADASTLWALAFWLQGLLVLMVGAVWAWRRWGRPQAWILFLPPVLVVGLNVSGEAARLLPNLM